MKNSISISQNKVLKLTNVLTLELNANEEGEFNRLIIQMENYIKSKGALPIGPLIQKTSYEINADGKLDVHIYLMRQSNNFINNVEKPYHMDSMIRVRNCIYARYIGPEEKLNLAYAKININAFEEDIDLSNESYTIFVNKQDDIMTADIFVEKKSDE